jgi:large subunit ribosomal protein L9
MHVTSFFPVVWLHSRLPEVSVRSRSGLTIEIVRQAGEGDRLYGSVTSKDIADAIKAKGYDVAKKDLVTDGIKDLGEHAVVAKLGSGVEAKIKVVVKKS